MNRQRNVMYPKTLSMRMTHTPEKGGDTTTKWVPLKGYGKSVVDFE